MERKSKNRRHIYDLYIEREHEQWYWRVLGTLAPTLILLGFLVFPISFPSTQDIATSQSVLSIVSLVLLALGYSLSLALWFVCKSWLFQFDVLFLPCFISSALGAANVAISLGTHNTIEWSSAPISALALSLSSTTIYLALATYTSFKIQRVRRISSGRSNSHDTESDTLITEEDQQRKQFGKLLGNRKEAFGSSFASRFTGQGQGEASTYRLDIPESNRLAGRSPDRREGSRREGRSTSANPATSAVPLSGGLTVENNRNLPPVPRSVSPYSTHTVTADEPFNFDNTTSGQIGSLPPLANPFDFPESPRPLEGKAATLQAARDRTVHNARSRELMASRTGPGPMITNSRSPEPQMEQGIPLSERHPLEREALMRGHSPPLGGDDSPDPNDAEPNTRNKDSRDVYKGKTYRPQSDESLSTGHALDYGYTSPTPLQQPRFEIIEGDVQFDLQATRRASRNRNSGHMAGELEARMPRVNGRDSVASLDSESAGMWKR